MVNNIRGGYLATKALIERRHHSVYFITGPLTAITYMERMTGYLNALKESGIEYSEKYVVQCNGKVQGGYNALQKIYEAGNEPKSIFAGNDLIAIGVMRALSEKGKKIPEEVALIGYDDIPTAAYIMPSLSTIRQPRYQIGEKAAQILLDKISGKSEKAQSVVLEPELVIRESI
jgi:DNA-binding LacI/PurR family transcriptional regulator